MPRTLLLSPLIRRDSRLSHPIGHDPRAPRHPFLHSLARTGLCAALSLALVQPLAAQDSDNQDADPEAIPNAELDQTASTASGDLEAVQSDISLSEERIVQIRGEIEALGGDATQLGLELTAAAQRIDLANEDIRVIEERLEELFAAERSVRVRLDGHDRSISNLLASLQRISAQPPPAIIVDPSDALGAARAAMLLGSVLPQMQTRANTVTEDLNNLMGLKQTALAESEQLRANLQTLNGERLRIATIIEARKQGLEWLSDDLLREEAEARALADRASSLEQLIEGLEARIAAVTAADEATRAANAGQSVPTLDAETLRLAFADTSRSEPAVPLASARGYLTPPLTGAAVTAFGAADGFGSTTKGVTLSASAGDAVVAPADGWVTYSGIFLNYGQIVIINAGQDYTVVLAGLESVSVERGDFVLMGSQLGTMGEDSAEAERRPGITGPALYIEFREAGTPINPEGWWSARSEQQESGTS